MLDKHRTIYDLVTINQLEDLCKQKLKDIRIFVIGFIISSLSLVY